MRKAYDGRVKAITALEPQIAALSDDVTFAEVARAIGEELLDRDAPILLWHAAHELALVDEDDPDLRAAVLHRCLPHSESEGARCPAEAAAPLLRELGTRGAIRFLADAQPDLDGDAWRAIGTAYLRRELATQWHEWRDEEKVCLSPASRTFNAQTRVRIVSCIDVHRIPRVTHPLIVVSR